MVTKKSLALSLGLVGIFALAIFMILPLAQAVVTGGSITAGTPETAPNDTAGTADAYAGNVTELTINGFSTTQTWQGYFGNVTGTIQLADSNDNVLYNWTLASPEGEVYASINQTISWDSVQCFNYTATGTLAGGETAGQYSLFGTNLTQLEADYNIASDDVDGVDETFTLTGAGTHDLFYTASNEFAEGECLNTRIYDSTGAGVNNNFEEVLLYEPTSTSVIFASILDEEDVSGFDNAFHDFEMLVLEDGHGTDVTSTTYYFFVELE